VLGRIVNWRAVDGRGARQEIAGVGIGRPAA